MKNSSNIFICGTVRNCEPHLEATFRNIAKIVDLFADYRIIIAFDESDDKSLLKLVNQKDVHGAKIDILINRDPLSPRRTQNISKGRNMCIDKMIEHTESGFSADYFIMMDMDNVCSGTMNLDVLERAMARSDEWDSISFNKGYYYDIWALSVDHFVYICWGWSDPCNVVSMMHSYITNRLATLPAGELLECRSAFNGFAVYKTDKFINCKYDWRLPWQYITQEVYNANKDSLCNAVSVSPYGVVTDEQECEHRPFHMMATHLNNARIRISPEMLFPCL